MGSDEGEITRLLKSWGKGSDDAFSELLDRVYPELRKIAGAHFRGQPRNHTLQPTALVNEALLRLCGREISWESRRHFYGFLAITMRRILVDHARRRGRRPVLVELRDEHGEVLDVDVLDLDEAISELQESYPFDADVVSRRFFVGLTIEETARTLGVGHTKVEDSWRFSRAWLRRRLRSP